MKKLALALCLGVLCLSAYATAYATEYATKKVPRPKLVVGIVVDQMRWDYLYRYYERYGEGGFKRLLSDGFSCENTMLNYIPTVTAIGHSSVYTGSVPSIHGIAGNDFYFEQTGRKVYCTDDPSVSGVGSRTSAGKMSPRNLLVTTVTDELRLGSNFHSKTIGIALKDRASILPAGHTANAAYWFDDKVGKWISSSYYMQQLPKWVDDFNQRDLAAQYLKQDWNTLYPIDTYKQSTADDTRYERPFESNGHPTFPIRTSDLFKKEGYGVIRNTPYGNTLTLDMAEAALDNEQLGQGEYTDFLAVSFSSTDYVGHLFGVNAIETEDVYLRLDKDLEKFMHYLDKKVGRGNYTLFLTADHAAAHNVRFLEDHHIPSGAWASDKMQTALDSLVYTCFGVKDAIRGMENYQVHLAFDKLSAANVDQEQVKACIIRYLEKQPEIAYAVDMEKAAIASVPETIRERILNGFNRERSGSIQVIVKPGWYDVDSSELPLGTTHGVWYPYDSHIPLLFYGWGVSSGKTNREVHITDIAPTIAALLKLQMPSGCIGQPIPEVLK